jgi:hypothetical protein
LTVNCRQALELAEREAGRESVEPQLEAIRGKVRDDLSAAQQVAIDSKWGAASAALDLCPIRRGPLDLYFAQRISRCTAVAVADDGSIDPGILADLSLLLQDIFGVAACSGSIEPREVASREGSVAAIARGIDQGRAFGDLPVLADALEDAGCLQGAILDHLRDPGLPVRGCWAVDLILAKE